MPDHVVYIAESFNAGTLAAVRAMAWEMHARAWRVSVIHGRRPGSPEDLQALFPPDTALHELMWGRALHPGRELRVIHLLRRMLRDMAPTIVHLVSSKAGAAGRIAAWPRYRRRVAYSPQGWSFLDPARSRAGRALFWLAEWLLAQTGATVVACSESERRLGARLSRRCVTIENALPRPAAPGRGEGTGAPEPADIPRMVGTVGRVCPQKDPDFFVEVVRAVTERDARVRFTWIGDGEMRPVLESAQRRGLPIELTGWLEPEAVRRKLKEWGVFLMTSRYEGQPFAILEALDAGLPVAARNVAGNRDAVRDGVTGTLFRSPAEAATAVLRYLDDAALWRGASRAAQEEARTRFASERLGRELSALYDGMAGH